MFSDKFNATEVRKLMLESLLKNPNQKDIFNDIKDTIISEAAQGKFKAKINLKSLYADILNTCVKTDDIIKILRLSGFKVKYGTRPDPETLFKEIIDEDIIIVSWEV